MQYEIKYEYVNMKLYNLHTIVKTYLLRRLLLPIVIKINNPNSYLQQYLNTICIRPHALFQIG